MTGEDGVALAAFGAACFLTASSGAVFRPGRWFETIAKPSWQPPNWLFGPVWSLLFVMIAVSGWMVWRETGFEVGWAGGAGPLALYALQLVLNFLWSALFFGAKRIGLALLEMAALWLSILGCIVAFHPIAPTAALLLVPYLLWVSFAFGLNFVIWRLNADGGPRSVAGE